MIQINLISDVKRELLRAQALRNLIIFFSMAISAGAVALIVSTFLFSAGQTAFIGWKKDEIKASFKELEGVDDVNETIILQSQLNEIDKIRKSSPDLSRITSLIYGVRTNDVSVSAVQYNPETREISIEGQSINHERTNQNWAALESYQKTIRESKVIYRVDGSQECTYEDASNAKDPGCGVVDLAENKIVDVAEQSYGDSESGGKVTRFKIIFKVAPEVTNFTSRYVAIKSPEHAEVTDSKTIITKGVFAAKADNAKEDKK